MGLDDDFDHSYETLGSTPMIESHPRPVDGVSNERNVAPDTP
jgi:hypothetical protein